MILQVLRLRVAIIACLNSRKIKRSEFYTTDFSMQLIILSFMILNHCCTPTFLLVFHIKPHMHRRRSCSDKGAALFHSIIKSVAIYYWS